MNQIATLAQPRGVIATMAAQYEMDPRAFEATVRSTCIKPDRNGKEATREEFAAFLLVAKQYRLNPLTREIYAFADKGSVVPIVSIDGWANIINSHSAFDGMEFHDQFADDGSIVSITCRIHRKDRSHPTEATEYLAECKRDTIPWNKWPRRMLRHKAMIQAARYAFGFAGIYDPDEGDRIRDAREPQVVPLAQRLAGGEKMVDSAITNHIDAETAPEPSHAQETAAASPSQAERRPEGPSDDDPLLNGPSSEGADLFPGDLPLRGQKAPRHGELRPHSPEDWADDWSDEAKVQTGAA